MHVNLPQSSYTPLPQKLRRAKAKLNFLRYQSAHVDQSRESASTRAVGIQRKENVVTEKLTDKKDNQSNKQDSKCISANLDNKEQSNTVLKTTTKSNGHNSLDKLPIKYDDAGKQNTKSSSKIIDQHEVQSLSVKRDTAGTVGMEHKTNKAKISTEILKRNNQIPKFKHRSHIESKLESCDRKTITQCTKDSRVSKKYSKPIFVCVKHLRAKKS